jgi:hypothetical protein
MKFELGEELKDRITGLAGVVMGRTEYLTGCTHYGLLPKSLTKDGKIREWEWIDESRLERVSNAKKEKGGKGSGPGHNPPSM